MQEGIFGSVYGAMLARIAPYRCFVMPIVTLKQDQKIFEDRLQKIDITGE